MRALDFSRNHVEGKISESVRSMKNLQVVNLGSDVFLGIIPFVIGNFIEFLFVDLSENPNLVIEFCLNTKGA